MTPTSLTAEPLAPLRPLHWAALVSLLLATAAVRLWGLDHALPHHRERDAHMGFHVELLRHGYTPPDPLNNDNQYPSLMPALLAALPLDAAPPPAEAPLEQHLDSASRTLRDFRAEMALLSVVGVALTFALARRFVTNGWALCAAAMVAGNFLTQYFAQQARPHVGASVFFLAAVLACTRLARKPSLASYALAALCCWLAIGALHSGLALLGPLVVACSFAALYVVHEPARRLASRVVLGPLLALAVAGAGIAVFYRYLFRERTDTDFDTLVIENWGLRWGDHRVALADFAGGGVATLLRTLAYYDPALLALLVLALVVWIARKTPIYRPYERWSDLWVTLAFVLPYLTLIALFARTYERFVLPLTPYFAVFAAWGAAQLASGSAVGRTVARAAMACALVFASASVARLAWLRAAPDSMELAAAWIEEQLDPERDVVYCMPTFDLPLARSAASLSNVGGRPVVKPSQWSLYQARRARDGAPLSAGRWDLRYLAPRPDLGFPVARIESDPLGYLRALGAGYFVIDVSRMPVRAAYSRMASGLVELGAERVARIGPNEDSAELGWSLPFEDELIEGWPSVVGRVLTAKCTGPVIEIYRVK